MKIKKALLFIVFSMCTATGLHAADSATIDSIGTASPEARSFLANSILGGKYVEVQRNGDHAVLTLSTEPGISLLTSILQVSHEVNTIYSFFDKEAEAPSTLEHVMYAGSKVYELQAKQAREANTLVVSELLNDLVAAFPKDQQLLQASDLFVSSWGQARSVPTALQEANRKLGTTLLSTRLGFAANTLQKYPDLERFVKANEVDRLASQFHHAMEIDGEGQPMLMMQGKLEPWKTIKESVKVNNDGKMEDHFYGYEGIVEGSPSTTINVFDKESSPKYGNRYILEVMSFKNGYVPVLWVRLRDPEGYVYSVGWKSKGSTFSSWWYVLSPDVHNGEVLSPAPMEAKGTSKGFASDFVTTPLELTLSEYSKLRAFIDEYQKNPDACYNEKVQGAGGTENCGGFVGTILAELGITIPAEESYWTGQMHNNPEALYNWQQAVNEERKNKVEELVKKGAGKAELEEAMYAKPKAADMEK